MKTCKRIQEWFLDHPDVFFFGIVPSVALFSLAITFWWSSGVQANETANIRRCIAEVNEFTRNVQKLVREADQSMAKIDAEVEELYAVRRLEKKLEEFERLHPRPQTPEERNATLAKLDKLWEDSPVPVPNPID